MSTQLAPVPIFKAFSNDGTPLANGFLTTYAAGTTTPIATYTDSTGGTPNPNPAQLNARGELPLWLTPATAYKFLLTDVLGNTIPGYPVDNVTSVSGVATVAPSGNTAFAITTGTYTFGNVTDNPNYVFSGTGAVSAAAFIPTGTTVPVNGLFLSATNTLGFAAGSSSWATLNVNGNWTLTAPSTGTAITVTGVSGSASPVIQIQTNSSGGGYIEIYDFVNSAIRGYLGHGSTLVSGAVISDLILRSQAALKFAAGGNNQVMQLTSAGAVQIVPPSGVQAFTVAGAANSYAGQFNGASTTGQSYGLQVNAGTNTSDDAFTVNNQSAASKLLWVQGGGAVFFPSIGTTASAANAFLNTGTTPANSLLVSTSSIRYKTDVETLPTVIAERVMSLRPVRYRSTASADDPSLYWYGLVAEEVAAIDPRLVHYRDGQPDGVQYERLVVLLLKYLQERVVH